MCLCVFSILLRYGEIIISGRGLNTGEEEEEEKKKQKKRNEINSKQKHTKKKTKLGGDKLLFDF